MKYSKLIILLLLMWTGLMQAQNVPALAVSDIEIARKDADLVIDFTLSPRGIDIKPISEMRITPELVSADAQHSLALNPVTVGGRTRWIMWQRERESKRTPNLLEAGKSEPLRYHAVVPYESWMANATLNFRETVTGCNSCPKVNELIPVAVLDFDPMDDLDIDFNANYLHPKAEATKVRNLEGRAYVDFPVNKTEIYPNYRNNKVELAKILATIDTVKNDPDCSVSAVALKGYASPEGSYAANSRLAQGRTQTLCKYVLSFYDFPAKIVSTSFEAEDWAGLRAWVAASDIANKSGILSIIDSDLAPDAKDLKIKQSYPTQYAYLLKEVYPGLRHSDYKIEYVIRSFTNPDEIRRLVKTAPQKLSLEEFFVAANNCAPASEEYHEIFETAVRMYPADETANMNAANSAMARGDYDKAAKYLERAGNSDHANMLRDNLKKILEAKERSANHKDVTFL